MTTPSSPERGRRDWKDVWLFLAAAAWFAPGMWWGRPDVTATAQVKTWGVDELGPYGVDNLLRALHGNPTAMSQQYPLFHYFVQALLVIPYQLLGRVAVHLGLPDLPGTSTTLILLYRLPSVLMAAGTVVLARRIVLGLRPDQPRAAWVAAIATATIGPLIYYGATSNVDAAALFWTAVALLLAVKALRDGLSTRLAFLLGVGAALAVATKDQEYAYLAGLALVLVVIHIRSARTQSSGWWRPLVAGAVVAGLLYVIASGLVLLPDWFRGHVHYIENGSSRVRPELRALTGFYFSNPATPAGYLALAMKTGAQILAAVGLPMVLLALIGLARWRHLRPGVVALLVLPPIILMIGVIIPVRFVLPRFLLPVDFAVTLTGALALASAEDMTPVWRRASWAIAAVALAWTLVRATDVHWQMLKDSRYRAADWLARNLSAGDTLGYYGATIKLPRLRRDLTLTPAPGQYVYGPEHPLTATPQFLIVVPQQVTESDHEWSLPDSTFRGLLDGSSGYKQVYVNQTPSLFPRPLLVASTVNPQVRVFARADIASRIREPIGATGPR